MPGRNSTGTPRTYHELAGVPEITITTVESTDRDWFDLGVIVTIDGRSIPFTPLFTALSMRRRKMLLADGGWFSLAHPALQRLRDLLDEVTDLNEWETGPRINRHQTALWDDFEDLADEAVPAMTWRAAITALRAFLDAYPRHDLADNAQYWLGEVYYDQKDWARATVEFRAVIERYPKGNKVPDAMLKLGYCFAAVGQPTKARAALEQVISVYPRSQPAQLAARKLEELGR